MSAGMRTTSIMTANDPRRDAILTGTVSRTVWLLTWPSATALLLQTISNNVDRYFVAQLGGTQVAALGLTQNVMNLLFAFVVAISTATTAMVARFTGAGSDADAEEAARQSLYLAAAISLAITVVLYPLAGDVLRLVAGGTGSVVGPGASYLRISLGGLLPLFGMTIAISAFRGMGDMLTPVKLTLLTAILAAVLDWILIFGHCGLPAMGLKGAATSAVISRFVGCALGIIWLSRTRLSRALLGRLEVDWGWMKRILSLGVPAGLQSVVRSGASMVYFTFLGLLPRGEAAMAALTIGLGIEAIAFMPGFAYSTAAAAIVGQNLGARNTERAGQAAWACARQAVVVMGTMAALFFALAEPIASLFTDDGAIRDLTVSYLRINAVSEPFLALAMSLGGALQGAGDTRTPTIATFVTLWVFRLPLTYWLAVHHGLGVEAAWWSMSGSMALYGLVIASAFASGRWRSIEI